MRCGEKLGGEQVEEEEQEECDNKLAREEEQ